MTRASAVTLPRAQVSAVVPLASERPVSRPTPLLPPEPVLSQPILTEPHLTEPRLTEPRLTEPRLAEPRLTEPRLTEH